MISVPAAPRGAGPSPGKWNRPSRGPLGEGLGGGVALGGLLCWKGAGEEGVEEVVEEGLLLESSWFSTGGWSWVEKQAHPKNTVNGPTHADILGLSSLNPQLL